MKLLTTPSPQSVSAPNRKEDDAIAVDRIAGDHLSERHFALQRINVAEPPNLELSKLDPLLRTLLFTDGTVTRVLEAQTLCDVTVKLVDQTRTRLPTLAADHLDASDATDCLRRRVTMAADKSIPAVWAESHILPDRLPVGFLGLLESAPNGIGGSIEHARIESRRELLWFRLGKPPLWATPPAPSSAVVRLYRIITNGRPALLIFEAFAVERRSGMYHPLGMTGAVPDPVGAVALSSSE